jgi:hypothetical protein
LEEEDEKSQRDAREGEKREVTRERKGERARTRI